MINLEKCKTQDVISRKREIKGTWTKLELSEN